MNLKTHCIILILFFSCLLSSIKCFGQNASQNSDTSISLKKVLTNQKTFKGKIDNKQEITIHLNFFSISDANTAIYSVKGFYSLEKSEKHIPLVGIYSYGTGFTLYKFDAKEKQDTLLNFLLRNNNTSFWDQVEQYENLNGYSEKFILKSKNEGTWEKEKETHSVTLNTNELNLYYTSEYLCFNSNTGLKKIDLSKIGIKENTFELIKFRRDSIQTKVLLKYNYASRSYVMGMCGAGEEIGYLILVFDKNYKLLFKESLVLASCLDSIEFEEMKSVDANEKKFLITEYQTNKKTMAIVNLKNISITKKVQ